MDPATQIQYEKCPQLGISQEQVHAGAQKQSSRSTGPNDACSARWVTGRQAAWTADQSSVTARLAHIQAAGERLAHAARVDAMSLEARGLVVAVIAVVELV